MSDPTRWLDDRADAPEGVRELLGAAPPRPPLAPEVRAAMRASVSAAAAKGALVHALWPRLLAGVGVAAVVGAVALWPALRGAPHAAGGPPAVRPPAVADTLRPEPAVTMPAIASMPIDNAMVPIAETPARPATPTSVSAADGPDTVGAGASTAAAGPARAAHAPVTTGPFAPATSGASPRARPGDRPPSEEALLEQARVDLTRGDTRAALGALGEHARRFPRGEYTEEREFLVFRAHARAHDDVAARAAAARYLQRHPAGIYAPQVRRASQ